MRHAVFFMMLAFGFLAAEEPWGKDADLVYPNCKIEKPKCSTFFFGPFAEAAISFHQNIISPADGPRSHFYPSSSQYTLEAMRRYGFFGGYLLGCDRLMRENSDPWVYYVLPSGLKSNPVP